MYSRLSHQGLHHDCWGWHVDSTERVGCDGSLRNWITNHQLIRQRCGILPGDSPVWTTPVANALLFRQNPETAFLPQDNLRISVIHEDVSRFGLSGVRSAVICRTDMDVGAGG